MWHHLTDGWYILHFVCTPDEAGATQQATEDFLTDLDSVVAQQIDSRFKEIMLKKKGNGTVAPGRSVSLLILRRLLWRLYNLCLLFLRTHTLTHTHTHTHTQRRGGLGAPFSELYERERETDRQTDRQRRWVGGQRTRSSELY